MCRIDIAHIFSVVQPFPRDRGIWRSDAGCDAYLSGSMEQNAFTGAADSLRCGIGRVIQYGVRGGDLLQFR